MKRWFFIGILLTFAWMFVRGVTPSTVIEEFITGLLISMPLSFIFRRVYRGEMNLDHFFTKLYLIASYLKIFLEELVLANIDVARRVAKLSMPIDPGIIKLDLRTKNAIAITILANSITLTPGTLTLDHLEDKNQLLVHTIDHKSENEFVQTVKSWEDILLRITGEN
mgnify:CR=1 FL=1